VWERFALQSVDLTGRAVLCCPINADTFENTVIYLADVCSTLSLAVVEPIKESHVDHTATRTDRTHVRTDAKMIRSFRETHCLDDRHWSLEVGPSNELSLPCDKVKPS